MTAALAQHSAKSVEWYTPAALAEAARTVLGGSIDLDPASCTLANATVQARVFYSSHGAARPWFGSMLINPPGRQVGEFWARLAAEAANVFANFEHAVWIGFSLEQLATLQKYALSPTNFPTCIVRKRVRYVSGDGRPARSPTHSSYVTYVAGKRDCSHAFREVFSAWGTVR